MNCGGFVKLAIYGIIVFGIQNALADVLYTFTTIDVPGSAYYGAPKRTLPITWVR